MSGFSKTRQARKISKGMREKVNRNKEEQYNHKDYN